MKWIPIVLWLVGCAAEPPALVPPIGTDLTGEWMRQESHVIQLTHTSNTLSGTGRYLSDVRTDVDLTFIVQGEITNDPEIGEMASLRFSSTPWHPAVTNVYRVERSRRSEILVLRGTLGTKDELINMDQMRKRMAQQGVAPYRR